VHEVYGWDNFYLLVGSAAGALIGLLFVVVTLTANMDARMRPRGAQVYLTPIVFHFAIVVVVSAISEVPGLPPNFAGTMLAISAALGLAYSLLTTIRMFAPGWAHPPDASDRFFYGIFPAINYLALGTAAASVWFASTAAPYAVGGIMLVLLLMGIRNAWDLATFIVHNAPRGDDS
jgi:hypothetical protein